MNFSKDGKGNFLITFLFPKGMNLNSETDLYLKIQNELVKTMHDSNVKFLITDDCYCRELVDSKGHKNKLSMDYYFSKLGKEVFYPKYEGGKFIIKSGYLWSLNKTGFYIMEINGIFDDDTTYNHVSFEVFKNSVAFSEIEAKKKCENNYVLAKGRFDGQSNSKQYFFLTPKNNAVEVGSKLIYCGSQFTFEEVGGTVPFDKMSDYKVVSRRQ